MRGLYARAERALALLARGMQRESAASPLPSGVNGEIEDFVVHTHLAERLNYIFISRITFFTYIIRGYL